MYKQFPLIVAAVLTCLLNSVAEAKKAALDERLYTTYRADGPPGTGYDVVVCGAVGQTDGCYGVGAMVPPFEHACALLEGSPKTNGNVMTRDIYVLDKRSSSKTSVMLYVYTRTDTFSENSDSVDLELTKQVELGMTGGSKAKCYMAGNDTDVYAGTSTGAIVSDLSKKKLSVTSFNTNGLLVGLDADERGDVTVNFVDGWYIIAVNGFGVGGGGSQYTVGTRNSWKPQ
ncbi:MAG: hypothetical protein WDM89_09585, partial [Rhizomicrobium sp.]